MQIPISWINELVNIETLQLDNLIDKLTLGGFEVEEILEVEVNNKKEIILDISATANRSDSLSIQGISTEISALLNQQMKSSDYLTEPISWKQNLERKTKSIPGDSKCSMFLAVTVENLTNINVPKWMTQKLLSSGLIPSNDINDFQNYVLLETGYPFSFYDFEKIGSRLKTPNFNLSISPATEKQSFLAKNNETYELSDSILTINANETAISIAGLIEAQEFACSESTKTLLIEGSIFNAAQIRQQSRKLGIRTDRSARYEKSLKNTYLIESFYRLIFLLRINNPNLICKLHTINKAVELDVKPILLKYDTINEILGPTRQSTQDQIGYITPEIVTDYLTRLHFKFSYDSNKSVWEVKIPHSRTEDLTREIDLIEEIGRLHGFNNFLTRLPKIKRIGNEDPNYKTRKKMTACFLNLGFNELIHYSLVNEETFLTNPLKLINPLLSDCSNLRISLLPSLLKTLQENLKQKNICIEGFEYGHVFCEDPLKNFREKEYVAGIFGGIKTKKLWSDQLRELSWFEAKGKIEQVFNQLNLLTFWKRLSVKNLENIFHPYRSAELYLPDNSKLGNFGQIHPILANQLNLSPEIYLFEFDLEIIKDQLQKNKLMVYKEYSLYPKIVKDLSFIIHKDIEFKQVQEILYSNGTNVLSKITLLDEYRGDSIPENHTSLCLQLVFQSNQKTLENKHIESILNELQLILNHKFNAIIRE